MGDTIGVDGLRWSLKIEGKLLPNFVEDLDARYVESEGSGVAAGGEVVGGEAPDVLVRSGGELDGIDRTEKPEGNSFTGGIEEVDFESQILGLFVGDLGANFDDGIL